MSKNNTHVVLPFAGGPSAAVTSKAAPESFSSVIIHGAFETDAAREEFMQAIVMHGVTFLRAADSALAHPTIDDLSVIERLARTLNCIWQRQSSKAVRS